MTIVMVDDRPTVVMTFDCSVCGTVPTKAGTEHGVKVARGRHAATHRRAPVGPRRTNQSALSEDVTPAQHVLARAASLRLTVVAAKARIGMWQACPAMDPARNADQVLDEVRRLLEHEGGPT